jgi:hypothetical protein
VGSGGATSSSGRESQGGRRGGRQGGLQRSDAELGLQLKIAFYHLTTMLSFLATLMSSSMLLLCFGPVIAGYIHDGQLFLDKK